MLFECTTQASVTTQTHELTERERWISNARRKVEIELFFLICGFHKCGWDNSGK